MPIDSKRAKAIFLEAVDKITPAEREAFLQRACAGDAPLLERVQALLRSHEATDSALDCPAAQQFSVIDGARQEAVTSTPPLESLTPSDSAGDSAAGAEREDPVLAFLAPASRPGSLGRLGHYEILEVIGRGGFGIVFKSFDDKLHRIVAIKVLAPELALSAVARQRFLREARTAAAVRNDHVIDIHVVEEQPLPYLVMAYIDGPNLQQKLDRTGPLPVKEILRIGMQIAQGLAAAHKAGLIHRDIKPSNILLENDVQRVKISDFGLARLADDASMTQSGLVAGTPLYMSPEQAEARHVDHRSDLFSLGSVLYALSTGCPPFRADSTLAVLKRVCEDVPRPIHEINADIPAALTAVIDRLLAKKPEDRFQRATDVAETLGQRLSDLRASAGALPANSVTFREPIRLVQAPRNRPRKTPLILVLFLCLASLAVLILLVVLRPSNGPGPLDRPRPKTPDHATSPLAEHGGGDIPPSLLALVGADQALVPPDLVAVLGDGRLNLTGQRLGAMETSPDGRWLVVSCGGRGFLFDAKTGELMRQLPVSVNHVSQLTFSADSKLLASAGDTTAQLWEVETGKLLQTFHGHARNVVTAIVGPENKTVISGSTDFSVRVWDVATGKQLLLLPHADKVHAVAVSPDGKWLVTGCDDSGVRVFEFGSGQLHKVLPGHTGHVVAVTFSADGKWLATGANELKIWDAASLQPVHLLPGSANWIAFEGEGRTLLTCKFMHAPNEPYVVTRWEVASGKKLAELTLKNQGGWASLALTPDGKTLFAARADSDPDPIVRAYDTATGKELFTPRHGHAGLVWTVAFSPNGQLLASGGKDHGVRLWNLAGWRRGEKLPPGRTLGQHANMVWCVRFSPDGKLLASGSMDKTIALWDTATGKKVRTLKDHSNTYSRFDFAPDGKTIAGGREDGTINLWNVATGLEKSALSGHTNSVRCVAYSPDGKLLASTAMDAKVRIYDTDTEVLVEEFALPRLSDHLTFTADGKQLVATTDFGNPSSLIVWETATWKRSIFPSHFSHVPALALAPTGPLAATGGYDRTVRFWDLRNPLQRMKTLGPGLFGDVPNEVAFSPDGQHLAATGTQGIVIVKVPEVPGLFRPAPAAKASDARELAQMSSPADALDPKAIPANLLAQAGAGDAAKAPALLVAILRDPGRNDGQVLGLAIDAEGKLLASCGANGLVRLWNVATGKLLHTLPGHRGEAFAVAFSPDGQRLASGAEDGLVRLWDVATGKECNTPLAHGGSIRQILFTPDGHTLAVAAAYAGVKLWDLESGKVRRTLWGSGEWSTCLALSPDAKTLATGHEDGFVRLWDMATGWQVAALGPHPKTVRCLSFTPNGQTLAVGGTPYLRLWDLTTLQEKQKLVGHTGTVPACSVRADGGLLASVGDSDGTLRLWGLTSPQAPSMEVRLFPPNTSYLHGVTFTADGRYLATANPNGTVYLLKLAEKGHVFHVEPTNP